MALPEPTISDFIETGRQGIVSVDKVSDMNRGSDYESRVGPNAILWSRQVQRDTDLWKATRFNDADGPDLTTLAQWRYGIPRTMDARGVGTATLSRPNTSGGTGTFYRGTRIAAVSPNGEPTYYRVTADTVVTATTVVLPIRAVEFGPGPKAATSALYEIKDAVWDATWKVDGLICSDGTTLEAAPVYRARIRQTRADSAPGSEKAIIAACSKAGAGNVALFPSNYAGVGNDYGLNYAYVGDSGYSASADLIRACTLALRSVRVAGDNLQVLPLARVDISVVVDVYFRDTPASMPISRLDPIYRKAIIQYFGATGRFNYSLSGIETAIALQGNETQDVVVATPSADAAVLVGGAFPQSLSRYFVSDNNILIRYNGPN